MKTFASFVIKETKHILRDPRTVLILFVMPIVMMLLFGYAVTNDVKNVRTVIVSSSMDEETHRVIDRLGASEYFGITRIVATPAEAEQEMRRQKADMAVVFVPNYANHRYDGTAGVQIIADAADPNMAIQQSNYATQIIQSANAGTVVSTKMLYNPQMRSAYNFVPGIMGMLLLLICAMMTSVSIVREKERGTMEVLLVSPIRPLMIIIAKAVPYFLLSILILICILLLSTFLLDVPVAGSIFWIFAVSLLYILLALSVGLLVSVVATTQFTAILVSGMVMLMPSMLLSGMIYPVASMPAILQYISYIVPAQWYISAMRKLMIMGVGIESILKEVSILFAMTAVLLTVALKKFNKRLE